MGVCMEKFLKLYNQAGSHECRAYKELDDALIAEWKKDGFIGVSFYNSYHLNMSKHHIYETVFWSGMIKSVQEAFNLGWIDKTQYASFNQKKHTWVHYHNQKILSGTGEYRLCS